MADNPNNSTPCSTIGAMHNYKHVGQIFLDMLGETSYAGMVFRHQPMTCIANQCHALRPPALETLVVSTHAAKATLKLPTQMNSDDLLKLAEVGKARLQHYVFVHKALPQIAFTNPAHVVGCLHSPDGKNLIQSLWDQVCSRYSEPSDLSADSIKVHTCRAEMFPCAIVEMPLPLHDTEAYFAALILRRVMVDGASVPMSPELLYYTLEKGRRDDGSERTVFCAWTHDGTHHNYGDGSAPTLSHFIQLVSSKAAETIPAFLPPASIPPKKWWQFWK